MTIEKLYRLFKAYILSINEEIDWLICFEEQINEEFYETTETGSGSE